MSVVRTWKNDHATRLIKTAFAKQRDKERQQIPFDKRTKELNRTIYIHVRLSQVRHCNLSFLVLAANGVFQLYP